uniref:Uncharacterized protein n=1 Tax=Anopheles quadriannulatus TaxID=34691 RepID=A0A182XT03_ANOQN
MYQEVSTRLCRCVKPRTYPAPCLS